MQIPRAIYQVAWLVLPFIMAWGCARENEYKAPPAPKVTVAKPLVKTVTIYLEENGETEAVERAEVSARVRGFLEEIKFQPGAEVEEGQVLYVIEQRQYIAARDAAKAKLSAAQAALSAAEAAVGVANAAIELAKAEVEVTEVEFQRREGLLKDKAIAKSEWDQAKAKRDQALASQSGAIANTGAVKADVEKAKADVEKAQQDLVQAELDLEYTEVKVPIGGQITKTDVKRGNLVENGSTLATVVKDDPIWANFNIGESYLLELQRTSPRQPGERLDITTVKAFLKRTGDRDFQFEGHLDYLDPEVDRSTGTLAVRAVFENSDRTILPGLFVRVRVPVGNRENSLLVPEKALSRDQLGSYLLVVTEGNIVERRNVVVGPKEKNLLVIEEGLATGDMVIVEGLQRARPGNEVSPQETKLSQAELPVE